MRDTLHMEGSVDGVARYNIRSMKATSGVTVMKRFEAYAERVKTTQFNARKVLRKAVHLVTAVRRLNRKTTDLRSDFMVITGHDNGMLRIRNFDSGEVVGSCSHFNGSSVSCLCVTNCYIYTAVEPNSNSRSSAANDQSDVYVWDMTSLDEVYLTLTGHCDRVTAITVPPWNENTPVTGGVDKSIIIWDITKSRKPIHILEGHTMMLKYLLLTKRHIISGSSDQSLRVWDWDGNSTSAVEAAHQGPLQYMSFGPDPDCIISACGGGVVRETAIDPATGQLRSLWFSKPGKGQVLDVAFDADYVASSTSDSGNVYLYIRAKKSSVTFTPHDTSVRCLEMDAQRKVLLTGCDDGSVTIWDYDPLSTGHLPTALLQSRPHKSAILNILMDIDSRGRWERVFTSAADSTIFTLDFNVERDCYRSRLASPIISVAEVTPTGSLLITDGNRVSVFSAARMAHKSEVDTDGNSPLPSGSTGYLEGHKDQVTGITFSEETMKIVTVGADALMCTWCVSLFDEAKYSNEELISKESVWELRGSATCIGETFQEVAVVGSSKTARGIVELLNFITGEPILHFSTTAAPVRLSLMGERDCGLTHVVVQSASGEITLHDMGGASVATLAPASGNVPPTPAMAGTPSFATQQALHAPPQHLFWTDDSFSPARGMVLTNRDDILKEHRITLTGSNELSEVRTSFVTQVQGRITCMALLRQSGLHCVVGTDRCVFHVFDRQGALRCTVQWDGGTLQEGEQRIAHRGNRRESFCDLSDGDKTAAACCIDANLEGRYIVMGFLDGVVVVWDTANSRTIQRFFPHDQILSHIKVLPNSRRILSVSSNNLRLDVLHNRDDRSDHSGI